MVIPEGSGSRWDFPNPVDVVHLYLPHRTLARVADEADTATPIDLLERTAHPDPITSRLLLSAADVLEGNEALDSLFRQQLTDLLATRLLAAHAGAPATVQPVVAAMALGQRHARFARSTPCRCQPHGGEEWPGTSRSVSLQTLRAGRSSRLPSCPRFH